MTTAQVVETSVTNNSLSKDYLHPDDHDKPITDTPGFKPFTNLHVIMFYMTIKVANFMPGESLGFKR